VISAGNEVKEIVCAAFAVAGNTAAITPEFAEWVTKVAPATVKKFALTPVNVKLEVAVRVIVAV
jgi:hypothetical protein